jgi:hypothetical protein
MAACKAVPNAIAGEDIGVSIIAFACIGVLVCNLRMSDDPTASSLW